MGGLNQARMSMKVFCAVLVAAASALPMNGLRTWESHGETMDNLDAPAVTSDLISKIKANNPGWEAGENSLFLNATIADAKVLMGTLQNADQSTWLPYKETKPVQLPTEFDWRTDPRAKSCPSLSEIRDQANCGSCWAFGSVEAMSDRSCLFGGKYTHFSAQDVTSCDKLGDMGCSGGIPSTVYTYAKTFGIVDGGNFGDKSGCWSYQLSPCAHHINGSKYPACAASTHAAGCARKCENGKGWGASKVRGKGGYSVCQQGMLEGACAEAMAQDIYQNGPITGMFFVKQDFLTYKSGVYKPSLFSPMLGGHAIKIMGFGTESGTPYWLVANSWNEEWGDKGYFKIKRGSNACQIENAMINGGPVAGHFSK